MKRLVLIILFVFTVNGFSQIKFSAIAEGGAYFPIGAFSDTYKTAGYGGNLVLNFISNSSMEIGIITGYSRYEADEEELKKILTEQISSQGKGDLVDLKLEAPLQIYPLALNVVYILKGRRWKPFFSFSAGLFFYDLTVKGELTIDDEEYQLPESVEKKNSTMLALSGGTKYKISQKFYLTGTLRWSILNNIRKLEVDKDEKIKSIDKTVQTIGVLIGVNYYF